MTLIVSAHAVHRLLERWNNPTPPADLVRWLRKRIAEKWPERHEVVELGHKVRFIVRITKNLPRQPALFAVLRHSLAPGVDFEVLTVLTNAMVSKNFNNGRYRYVEERKSA